jgi:hypothetical protein
MCTTVAVYSKQLYCTCGCEHMYIVQYIWERVQDGKKQEWQKYPAGARQTDGKNWGLVWRNRKKISQIIKDYFHLPFFLLIILCGALIEKMREQVSCPAGRQILKRIRQHWKMYESICTLYSASKMNILLKSHF